MENAKSQILNKNMLERLIIIHNAIKSGIYPNKEKLRQIYKDKIGCEKEPGTSTISRDIDILRTRFGAPLEFDRFKKGYYYIDDNWDFALNNLSPREAFYLLTAKSLLGSLKDSPLYNEINDVIDFVTETQIFSNSKLLNRITVPPTPLFSMDENVWNGILSAMENNHIIEFDYQGRVEDKKYHRRVHPYQIVLEDGKYFLFCFSEEKNAERIFSLKHIENLKITNDNFQLPDNFDFNSRCNGGKFGAYLDNNVQDYEIKFFNESRNYVKDYIWADNQEIIENDDNSITLKFSSSQQGKILSWVLSQGANAMPLAPDKLVEEWKNQINKLIKSANI